MTLVDSNVLLDVLSGDPVWSDWSQMALGMRADAGRLLIVDIVFSEISVGFVHHADVEVALDALGIDRVAMQPRGLFAAAKAFMAYRAAGGPRSSMLPDFLIGAHALTEELPLLTRDRRRYQTYFPQVPLIAP